MDLLENLLKVRKVSAGMEASQKFMRAKPWYLLPDQPGADWISAEEWVEIGTVFGLTGRELSALILVFEDRTRRGLATRLKRSTGGVRKRIDKVFKKMNVTTKLGLVQRTLRVHDALKRQGRFVDKSKTNKS
jgi:DNA-binding NarL/FixJ family response regulator